MLPLHSQHQLSEYWIPSSANQIITMKVFIVLSVVAACAFAKPTTTVFTGVPVAYAAAPLAYAAPVAVSSQFHAQDELGQYNYGYSSGLSSKVESKSLDGITRGGYSYVDAEGKVQNVQYTADDVNGFRVAATNLPVAPVAELKKVEVEVPKPVVDTPEVAAAKIQHMAAVEEAKARTATAEVEIITPVVSHAPVVPIAPLTHITPVATPAVATVKYAAPATFAYGYTAAAAPYTAYTSNFVGAPVAYAAAPVAYPHGYAYTYPGYNYVNVVPTKIEEMKEMKA